MQTESLSKDESEGDRMRQEHAVIARLLHNLREMIRDGEAERAEYNFPDLDRALRSCIRFEEQKVFPQPPSRGRLPFLDLCNEHRVIERALDGIGWALKNGQLRNAKVGLDELRDLLHEHEWREEQVLDEAHPG
jgi:hypothetical protein